MGAAEPISSGQVRAWHRSLSNWGRWGDDDQLGCLNHLTPDRVRAAASRVISGRTVSCSRALPTEPGPENPTPVAHHMIGTASEGWGADYIALAPHGYATSHIDGLCHVFDEGRMYNGYPAEAVTAHGATELGIEHWASGIVGRGVLLDIPRHRGVEWLDAGEAVTPDELDAAESRAGLEVGPGDILLVRTGRWKERDRRGGWDPHEKLAGLHGTCLPWLHERGVAVLGSDGVSDAVPSGCEEFRLPIHSVGLVAMGLPLLDNLDLEALAVAAREEGRQEFLLTVAPLVIVGGTASPVNPVAVF